MGTLFAEELAVSRARRDSIGVWDDLGTHEFLKIPAFPIENSADQPEICRNKNDIRLNTDLFNIFLNSGNGFIVFNSSSSNPNLTSTRSC